MLQCILVAVRPLRVEELAEVLAFEFDGAQGEVPKYRAAWQLDDQTQAVLATCSSLVTIVNDGRYGRQVVHFSHFSVKEFLMSDRLGDFSRYHIHHTSAHVVLTQACLGALLHLDDNGDAKSVQDLPLAKYAAQHCVEHVQFQGVAPCVKNGLETLFDPDRPHFVAWLGIYNMEDSHWQYYTAPKPNPLYYAVCCGLYDLVDHLAIKHPQIMDAISGRFKFPLFAALEKDQIEIVELLLKRGANVDARGTSGTTMLLEVLSRPQHNLVRIVTLLLKHGADVNAQTTTFRSSLHLAEYRGELKVAQIILDYMPDVNSQDGDGRTPLHILLECETNNEDGALNHARLLFERGAEVNRRDKHEQTLAMVRDWFQLAQILLEKGADVNVASYNGKTPLHILLECRRINEDEALNHARLLFERGTEVNKRDKQKQTPLHLTMVQDWFQLARILLEKGADVNEASYNGKTPLHILLECRMINEDEALNHARLLFERGAEVNRRNKNDETPLHLAMRWGQFKLAGLLLEHGADVLVENKQGEMPLHILSKRWTCKEDDVLYHARLLLERGAKVNRRDKDGNTPLLLAMMWGRFALARLFLQRGADANAEDNNSTTPLHLLSQSRIRDQGDALDIIWPLLQHGASVKRRDKNNRTPLLLAIGRDWFKLARILLEQEADTNAKDNSSKTPVGVHVQNVQMGNHPTLYFPTTSELLHERFVFARALLVHGTATINSEDHFGRSLLHLVSNCKYNFEQDLFRDAEVNDGGTLPYRAVIRITLSARLTR